MAATSVETTAEERPLAPLTGRAPEVAVLTGLRGLAALVVVVTHTAFLAGFPWLSVKGYGPVSLFVLSGFLLYRPWARWLLGGPRPSVRTFTIRRILRIFPAYLVVVLVVALAHPASAPESLAAWLRALTLTEIYHPEGLPEALQQVWSLGTELSWYVVLPVLGLLPALLAPRLTPRARVLAALGLLALTVPLSLAYRVWMHAETERSALPVNFWLPAYLACFAAGASIGLLLEAERARVLTLGGLRRVARHRWALAALAFGAVVLTSSSLGGPDGFERATFAESEVRHGCALLLAVVLLLMGTMGDLDSSWNSLLRSPAAGAIGRWSYGLYLWHMPVLLILWEGRAMPPGFFGFLFSLAVVLGVSVVLAAATWALVERPAIAWSHRLRSTPGRRSAG